MPTPDTERYLAVLKVSYDYEPQSSDEIAIKEDQILFLIERTDDDWWKVKIKGESQDADTPVGLVPMAYVEQAEHKHLVKALYDYEPAAPGELAINEDEVLLAFELDEDWLLVQSQKKDGGAGYVPGNYVEETTGDEPPPAPRIIIPPSDPRPVSTYIDPADRVAASKVTADDIKTWSVSEVDKKGKKKKGTLGIGNGSVFFASESDKTPVQKWQTSDITNVSSEKAKHVGIEIGGSSPITLLFNVGKDHVEEIIKKLESSRELARPAAQGSPSPQPGGTRFVAPAPAPQKNPEKGTVRFSPASPTIIPPREDDVGEDVDVEEEEDREEEEEPPHRPTSNGHVKTTKATGGKTAVALYDFDADGEDELSVVEGEEIMVMELDSDEWWKCRNAHGAEGVVPASYIELKTNSSTSVSPAPPQPTEEENEEDTAAAAAKAKQEAADRAEARRLQQEEEDRAAKERKRQEAQRRAREADAAVAEAERQKRRAASLAAAKKSPPPGDRPEPRTSTSTSTRKSQDVTFPPAEHVRTWHDRSGQFRVDAAFLGFNNGKLRLHKINGVVVEVPTEKMSVDDMKFVEKLTRKSRSSNSGQERRRSDDDIPLANLQNSNLSPPKLQIPPSTNQPPKRQGPRIDWFDFFLSAGCDMDDCTRYASSFDRDKIDEAILPDITDATMRLLGLREGDIIRVKKAIEKRHPGENLEKQSPYIQQQLKKDEELARQLQAQETGGAPRAPAPNLFASAGGVLKGRRVRKETTKTLPTNVDLSTLSSASEQINQTASPQATSPTTRPGSTTLIQPAKTTSLPAPTRAASGFDDDAWVPRPSSAKPATATSSTPPASTNSASVSAPTPPAPPSSAPPTTTAPAQTPAPAPASAPAPTSVPSSSSPSKGLSQTTESDIFDQLARLSQLRVTPQPPGQPQQQQTASTPVVAPPSFSAGLGMGNSSVPMGQALAAQQGGFMQTPHQPAPQLQQPYNGPRGPFAPVPANQGLLQPLIPTQTGFNSFIPTRPASNPPPASTMSFQNQFNQTPSFMAPQPTGLPNMGMQHQQPMMAQPTGIHAGLAPSPFGSGSMINASPFGSGSTYQPSPSPFNPSPAIVQPTGVFAHSPFNQPASPPPVPSMSSGNSNVNSTAPANVFASMKSGTFGQDVDLSAPQHPDKYNALRPNITPQQAGWGYGNGY